MASSGALALLALRLQGEVDHHDAVLLDDADEQDDADEGDEAEIRAADQQGQQGPHPGRRQGGEDGDRVDVALVENPQHDVDRQQRRQDQTARWPGRPGRPGPCPGKLPRMLAGSPIFLVAASMAVTASPRDAPGGQVEGDGDRGELALVVDGQGEWRWARKWVKALRGTSAAVRGLHVDVPQRVGRCQNGGATSITTWYWFKLGVDDGHLALAEGVVEGVVDQLGRDAEPGGGVAVDRQSGLQPLVLLIAVHIDQFGQGAQLLQAPGAPRRSAPSGSRPGGCTDTGGAGHPADPQVLDRLQIGGRPRHLGELLAQPGDHLPALAFRSSKGFKEMNMRAVLVVEPPPPPPPVKPTTSSTSGSLLMMSTTSCSFFLHGLEGDVLRRLDRAAEPAGVLLGEKALGNVHEQARC